MSAWVALTVLGADRPGIVAGITRVLYEQGCNLEDSSAMRLRDSFAMIVIARLPAMPDLPGLRAKLDTVAQGLGVHCDLRELGSAEPQPQAAGHRFTLAVHGADQPGIVYRYTQALADLGCNVTEVTTHQAGSVYIMLLTLMASDTAVVEALNQRLAELQSTLQLRATLTPDDEEAL